MSQYGPPAIVIAGTASGVGKTTIALGITRALRLRGLAVQPFKVGPDYIDAALLSVAAGRPCRNIDLWLFDAATARGIATRAVVGADVCIVEGVMGVFDGRLGTNGVGSTAHVARVLGAPIVLVVDASRSARGVGATVLGFARFDPRVAIAGVIVNRLGSERHADEVRASLSDIGVPLLGCISRDAELSLPERYLGLHLPGAGTEAAIDRLASAIESTLDLDALQERCRPARLTPRTTPLPIERARTQARIGVARDEAFAFYYQDNLDMLEAQGAELVPFSPIHDERLPEVDGIYLGGGYPELSAHELAANASMVTDIRHAVAADMPVYAECGGLMYLSLAIVGRDGRGNEMVAAIPTETVVSARRQALGYREVELARDTVLFERGQTIRGHEFRWSNPTHPAGDQQPWTGEGAPPAWACGNTLASYLHVHFAGTPSAPQRFVHACATWRRTHGPARATPKSRPAEAGLLLDRHGKPADQIMAISKRRLGAAAGDGLPDDPALRAIIERVAYAAGEPELVRHLRASPDFASEALTALRPGCWVVVDVQAVAVGINSLHRELGIELAIAVNSEAAGGLPWQADVITRSAGGIASLADRIDGAVVAIGNAPTALLALLDLVQLGRCRPAAVIGLPVGLVAAAESKACLERSGLPFLTLPGTRGGSPLATGAVNALLSLAVEAKSLTVVS